MVVCTTASVSGVSVKDYRDLVYDLRYGYMSNDGSGPEIGDKITIFWGCPELCRKTKT